MEVAANAAFIVRACNSHDALVKMVGLLQDRLSLSAPLRNIDAINWAKELLASLDAHH